MALTWQSPLLHSESAKGWKANGILNALNGSEDHLASSEVREFWKEAGMDRHRTEVIDDICTEFEHGRVEWSFEYVYAQVQEFTKCGMMDSYVEGQEDEGETVCGGQAWDDREGPSPSNLPGMSHERGPETPAVVEPSLDKVQQAEVAFHIGRMEVLDKCLEAADGADESIASMIAKCIAGLRAQVEREASGRTQEDSAIAQAVRRAEAQREDVGAQLRQAREARRRDREAEDRAYREAVARLEHRTAEIARMEASLAQQKFATERDVLAREQLHQRRKAVLEAKEGFTAADLGQGQQHGGGERFRRNRKDLLEKVIRLGDLLPADKWANWSRWFRRMDDKGCSKFGRAWGSAIRDYMSNVIQCVMGGDSGAFVSWHAEQTYLWCLDSLELEVPGVAAAASSSGPSDA